VLPVTDTPLVELSDKMKQRGRKASRSNDNSKLQEIFQSRTAWGVLLIWSTVLLIVRSPVEPLDPSLILPAAHRQEGRNLSEESGASMSVEPGSTPTT